MNFALQSPTAISGSGNYVFRSNYNTHTSAQTYSPSRVDFIDSFYAVLKRWKSETAFLSDPDKITAHPSFSAIVENADTIAPLIIEELRDSPSLLVWALEDAFNEQPYSDSDKGDISAMSEGWISWAEANGRTIR